MIVYLISGKARSGKTTVANILKDKFEAIGKKVMFCNFTKYLKYYLIDYFGWDGREETKPRDLLQYMGASYIKNKLGKNTFFIDRTIEDIKILGEFFDICIIHDVRYPLEIEKIQSEFDNILIKVKRDNYNSGMTEKQSNHEVEVALDNYDENKFDYIIYNNGIDSLEKQVMEIMEKEV